MTRHVLAPGEVPLAGGEYAVTVEEDPALGLIVLYDPATDACVNLSYEEAGTLAGFILTASLRRMLRPALPGGEAEGGRSHD